MRKYVLLLLIMVLLPGCAPVAREPDNLALVWVLGVDGKGQVELTAICGKDTQSSVLRGRARGNSFEQARQQVVWSGEGKELSLTGVSHLVIGSDVELEKILFAILEDPDLGASAKVWLAEDSARDLLEDCEDPASDLELLELQQTGAPSVAQTVAALSTVGSVDLPLLKEEDGRLMEDGWSIWKRDK